MSLAPSADEEQQRSDQIALHFYTKLFHVVYQARAFPGELLYQETKDRRPKIDRWFNLEIPDSDLFPRELREIYKSLSSILATANHLRPSPPLRIHVLLVVPESSSNNQVLVTLSQSNTPQHKSTSRILIEPTPRYVLLETWKMQFTPNLDPEQLHPPTDVALPTIYKHAIPLFRSLYSLLRILPTWKLFKKLRRRTNSAAQFGIQLQATEGADDERTGGGSVLGFDKPPTTGHPPLPTLTHVFPSIPHPLGSFTLSTTYLESPTFQLDDLESLLSSKFISLDEGGFVPTLSSATTIATSHAPAVAPTATAAAAVTGYNPGNKQQRIQIHPRESSIADRFVIPSPSSSSSTNAGQGQGHFSHLRQPSLLHQHHRQRSDSYSSGNSPPSTTVPLPAALSRLRLESNQSSSSSTSHRPPPPSLLLLSPTTTSHSTSPSPTSKSPFSPPPLSSHTPPQNTIPLPSLPSLHSLHSLPSLQSLSSLPPISPSPSPTTTQAMPIKRPTINPFKTNTLLSASGGGTSTSLGAGGGQPGSAGSIHSIHSIYSHSGSIASLRHTNTASPLSREGRGGRDLSRSPPQHLQPLPFPTSGKVSSPTSSPGTTFQKLGASGFGSGSGHGTTGGTEIGPGIGMPGHRKRYSSSFTHRYTSSASVGSAGSGGSDGREGKGPEVIPISVPDSSSGVIGASGGSPSRSTGSGGGGGSSSSPLARGMVDEKSNSRSSSFLGKRTEDDDISLFMQDIETRKPLSGRWRMEAGGGASGEGTAHKRDRTDGTDGTDRTVRAQSGSSLASEGTMRDDRTVGGSDLGDEDEEGDEEEGDGDGEEMNQRYSHLNQPSPLSPRSRLNPSRYYYANPGTTTQHATPNTDTTASSSSARPNTSDFGSSSASPPGAIPTSQAEVEVRLKKMNEAFLKSLAGLDDGWSGQGSATGVAGTSSTSAFQLRSRDGERLMRLMNQQGSEEVIGAIELGGSGGSGKSGAGRREARDGREDS